jgi:hypothetical protein
VRLAGTVSPARPDRRIELEGWNGHRWKVLATTLLGAGGRFSFSLRTRTGGYVRLRVVLPGSGGAASRAVTLRVTR